ncbi:hypothetical protein B0J13DRAFT_538692 [Dactylonectria estremocensis]|uniref:Uncharacterized protein n=1 Tax=Dactylonectria estremocensis TaxID=1079267 RepID=A0A9P9FL65_9HYPO|nr:hypothetical protein B0J13DRAFT_538692 [Dactylonectria estremocensis]
MKHRISPCMVGTPEPMIALAGSFPLLGNHSRSGIPKVDARFVATHARLVPSIRWIEVGKQINQHWTSFVILLDAGSLKARSSRNILVSTTFIYHLPTSMACGVTTGSCKNLQTTIKSWSVPVWEQQLCFRPTTSIQSFSQVREKCWSASE